MASRLFSRRRVLTGAVGLVAVGLAGTGGLAALRGSAPHVEGLRCLSAHEHRTLTALAAALFPRGGAFSVGAADFDLARTFDGFLADEADDRRADLGTALLLLEYGPLLFERRLVTFSNLPEPERLRHFEGWVTSDQLIQRQAAVALRKFLAIVFYDEPSVWPGIGYALGPIRAEGAAIP